MPEEGSSRRRTVGFHMRAMPRESLRLLPPEGLESFEVDSAGQRNTVLMQEQKFTRPYGVGKSNARAHLLRHAKSRSKLRAN